MTEPQIGSEHSTKFPEKWKFDQFLNEHDS